MILIYKAAARPSSHWRYFAVNSVTGSITPFHNNKYWTISVIANKSTSPHFLGDYVCTLDEFPILFPEECI